MGKDDTMSNETIVLLLALILTAGFVLGLLVSSYVAKEKIEKIEAARDWWKDHALGRHKAGKYPPPPQP